QADSDVALENAADWFRNTALSRLDKPGSSLIVLTMQRLHVKDLSGVLIEAGWPKLVLPAIARDPADYLVGEDEVHEREVGDLLQPTRDSLATYQALEQDMGSRHFAAQYQQNPTPVEGNMIQAAWLAPRYDFLPAEKRFRRVVLSCDPAGKPGAQNDYTAIT